MHLAARSLSYAHGPTPVLAGVDLDVSPGDRVGIVGPNGSGKTTLLRLLAGELEPDAGEVRRSSPELLVAHLHQEVRPADGEGVLAYLARRTGVTEASAQLDAATADLAAERPGAADRYSDALDRWLGLGGADVEPRAAQALHRVGLGSVAADHPVARLSGGQKARVDLAAVVLHQASILLLDEPTNDLDASGLALLAGLIGSTPAGVVVVSHDRAFLEQVVTEVVELDGHDHRARRYAGGWAGYQRERELARDVERRAYQGYVEERDRLAERAKRQRGWAERGVRQATKRPSDGDKLLRNAHIARAEARAGDARRTEARLDRLSPVDKPWEPWRLQLRLADQARSGDVVVAASGVVVQRGSFRLGPIDLDLRFGDRVELAGSNGAGKTTLVEVLLGRLEPTSGWVRQGSRVVVGRLGQQRDDIDAGADVARAVAHASGAPMTEVRATLAALGLGPTHLARPPASLSAGERTRALLATFQLRGVNLLVLDEPTNHLDLPAVEQLEQALAGFAGTLLVASHDRRFVDALGLDRRIEVSAGTVRQV